MTKEIKLNFVDEILNNIFNLKKNIIIVKIILYKFK